MIILDPNRWSGCFGDIEAFLENTGEASWHWHVIDHAHEHAALYGSSAPQVSGSANSKVEAERQLQAAVLFLQELFEVKS